MFEQQKPAERESEPSAHLKLIHSFLTVKNLKGATWFTFLFLRLPLCSQLSPLSGVTFVQKQHDSPRLDSESCFSCFLLDKSDCQSFQTGRTVFIPTRTQFQDALLLFSIQPPRILLQSGTEMYSNNSPLNFKPSAEKVMRSLNQTQICKSDLLSVSTVLLTVMIFFFPQLIKPDRCGPVDQSGSSTCTEEVHPCKHGDW